MAERKKVEDEEHEFTYGDDPVAHFPYTHGDSLELAREKQRELAMKELYLKKVIEEEKQRKKLGDDLYDKLYGEKSSEHERIDKTHPQGYLKQLAL
jgi:poly-D-alanine transfer protein DltD